MSVDDAEKSRALVARLGLRFPLGSDADRSFIKALGVYDAENDIAWPAIFLLDAGGVVRWVSVVETYVTRPTPAVVLEAFDALPPLSADAGSLP